MCVHVCVFVRACVNNATNELSRTALYCVCRRRRRGGCFGSGEQQSVGTSKWFWLFWKRANRAIRCSTRLCCSPVLGDWDSDGWRFGLPVSGSHRFCLGNDLRHREGCERETRAEQKWRSYWHWQSGSGAAPTAVLQPTGELDTRAATGSAPWVSRLTAAVEPTRRARAPITTVCRKQIWRAPFGQLP